MKIEVTYELKVYERPYLWDDMWHYELTSVLHECDEQKSIQDNLSDAFGKAVENGGDYRRTMQYRFID